MLCGIRRVYSMCLRGWPSLQQKGRVMPGTWSRSLLFVVALGLVAACEVIAPPEPVAPVAPVVAPPVTKPVATAPVVKKKPVIIDFGDDGGGGGGWN